MKFSVTLLAVLSGLAIANPVMEEAVEPRALDGNCVRCIRKGCGGPAVKCLKTRFPALIAGCLAAKCADDFARCCL